MNKRLLLVVLLSLVARDLQAISVQTLIDTNKIPQITGPADQKTLNLSGLKIDSLDGLSNIPDIDQVHVLLLNRNRLKIIRAGDLKNLTQLESIGIRNNLLTKLQPGSFTGPRNLQAVRLGHNKLKNIPDGVFDPKLVYLGLAANPISKAERAKLQEKLPNTQIFYIPPTAQILTAAGLTIATIALIVAAAKTTKKVVEEEQKAEAAADDTARMSLAEANALFVEAYALRQNAEALALHAAEQRGSKAPASLSPSDLMKKAKGLFTPADLRKANEQDATVGFNAALEKRNAGNVAWAVAAAFARNQDNFKQLIAEQIKDTALYPDFDAWLQKDLDLFAPYPAGLVGVDQTTQNLLNAQSALIRAERYYKKPYFELKARGEQLVLEELAAGTREQAQEQAEKERTQQMLERNRRTREEVQHHQEMRQLEQTMRGQQ